jgi:hypothetical protein
MEDGGVLCLSALVCLSACPRRRLLCIWFQWALFGLGFADAIVASTLLQSRYINNRYTIRPTVGSARHVHARVGSSG